jgi:hypothetical protein
MKARVVDGTGSNYLHKTESKTPFRSQEELYKQYKKSIQEQLTTEIQKIDTHKKSEDGKN